MKKLIRNCPDCGVEIKYKTVSARNLANRESRKCNICHRIGKGFTGKHHTIETKDKLKKSLSGVNNYMYGKTHSSDIRKKISDNMLDQSGKNNSFYGKHHTEKTKDIIRKNNIGNTWAKGRKFTTESIEKMRISHLGKIVSEETRKKMSELRRGSGNVMYGKHHTKETKRKIRTKMIERIQNNENNGLPIYPNFNKDACSIIEDYGIKNGYKFQHAMNGGELYIKDLGYWVDGYDKNKNTVIEYYELFHKRQLQKDKQRKHEIIKYLNCDFIEIKEWEM